MELRAAYPTPEHQRAADALVDFFSTQFEVDAVLLVNSCARGKATRDSCLDIIVLAQPPMLQAHLSEWQNRWEHFEQADTTIEKLRRTGKYSEIHLDFSNGAFAPEERDEAAGPDGFELGLGNFLAYSVLLWQGSDYLAQLKREWLPRLFEIKQFESPEIGEKAREVEQLLEEYAPEPS
jgi:predicted nucleotidyltransferase